MIDRNIPAIAELATYDHWVVWQWETREGKETKVPYSSRWTKARVNDSSTWLTFDGAIKLCEEMHGAGVGFVFTDQDPFVGIDLDACFDLETGLLEDWAYEIGCAAH